MNNTPTPPTCENCRFFNQINVDPDEPGECLRHAPITAIVHRAQFTRTVWPEVWSSLWCGDHEVKG